MGDSNTPNYYRSEWPHNMQEEEQEQDLADPEDDEWQTNSSASSSSAAVTNQTSTSTPAPESNMGSQDTRFGGNAEDNMRGPFIEGGIMMDRLVGGQIADLGIAVEPPMLREPDDMGHHPHRINGGVLPPFNRFGEPAEDNMLGPFVEGGLVTDRFVGGRVAGRGYSIGAHMPRAPGLLPNRFGGRAEDNMLGPFVEGGLVTDRFVGGRVAGRGYSIGAHMPRAPGLLPNRFGGRAEDNMRGPFVEGGLVTDRFVGGRVAGRGYSVDPPMPRAPGDMGHQLNRSDGGGMPPFNRFGERAEDDMSRHFIGSRTGLVTDRFVGGRVASRGVGVAVPMPRAPRELEHQPRRDGGDMPPNSDAGEMDEDAIVNDMSDMSLDEQEPPPNIPCDSLNIHIYQPMLVAIPNMVVPPPNMAVLVPNVAPPLPIMSMPPPNMIVPLPNMAVPPPNMVVPPPNMVVPPPNMVVPVYHLIPRHGGIVFGFILSYMNSGLTLVLNHVGEPHAVQLQNLTVGYNNAMMADVVVYNAHGITMHPGMHVRPIMGVYQPEMLHPMHNRMNEVAGNVLYIDYGIPLDQAWSEDMSEDESENQEQRQ